MEVPVISLAGCREALEAEKARGDAGAGLAELVDAVRVACEEVGFFVVVDHGVDLELLEGQRRECAAFFERPPQSTILSMVDGTAHRFAWLDFVPPAAGCGEAAASWSLGPVVGRGSMPWQPDSEALATTWGAYYAAMEGLVALIMRLLALGLGLPADAFDAALDGHRSSMRAILYGEVSEAELDAAGGVVVRSAEHTDWGCVTVLLPDPDVEGLEVCLKEGGTWTPLQPTAGGLVVNLGDLLPCWSRGRWVATPHRVVARGTCRSRRLSIPYFGLVNRATVLAPLVQADGESEEVLKDEAGAPLTAGEFFDKHHAYSTRRSAGG